VLNIKGKHIGVFEYKDNKEIAEIIKNYMVMPFAA